MNTDKQTQTVNTEGTIFQFLDGSHSYNGKWFGDYAHCDPFWWRRNLREELEALKVEWQRDAAKDVFTKFIDYPTTQSDIDKYLNQHYPLPQPPKQ